MVNILPITDGSDKPIVENAPENPTAKKQGNEAAAATAKVKKGLTVQKNYVLNDTSALKKKMRHEGRKEPYNLGTEARDGSNMVIEMKT